MIKLGFLVLLSFVSALAGTVTVDFYGQANEDFSAALGYPTGNQTLGGVTFALAPAGTVEDGWASAVAPGANPRILDIPVNIANATFVYLLINNYYGQPGPNAYASLEFTGTGGASHTKDLVGNVDIRDYLNNVFTNSINGTTTVNVFTEGRIRLDMVIVALPSSFIGQSLTSIKLIDNGADGFQRTFLYGVSVGTQDPSGIPEPHTFALAGLGLAAVALRKFRS